MNIRFVIFVAWIALIVLTNGVYTKKSYYNVRLPPPGAHRKHGTHKAQVKRQPGVHQTRHPRQSQYLAQMRKPSSTSRTTGPVFTLVKTDPRANFRWGVRHFVGRKYA